VNDGYEGDPNQKFKAYVDVQAYPTIKIFEFPYSEHTAMFYDQPTLPPEIMFYNERNQNKLKAILKPNLNNTLYDPTLDFQPITDFDNDVVVPSLQVSYNNVYGKLQKAPGVGPLGGEVLPAVTFSSDYFTGIYEVYRMEMPPKDIKDFAKHFLTTVDMDAKITFQGRDGSQQNDPANNTANLREFTQNNMNAHFEDNLVPNTKYYYLFRTRTYHGTPGNPSPIYEIELLSDSDETKINVKQYIIKKEKTHNYKKTAKRLIKILPNYEHLIFTGAETSVSDSLQNLGILDKKLFKTIETKKFKVRITSKHTGKKIDVNLFFKLRDNTN
jgi:hypothetical protein